MGGNRRYPHNAGRLAEERHLREARSRGPLHTLSNDQLSLETHIVSIAPETTPLWARAWLRFGDTDIRCTVRVLRWTSDSVGVEVEVDGERLRCWIWRGACTPLPVREDEW